MDAKGGFMDEDDLRAKVAKTKPHEMIEAPAAGALSPPLLRSDQTPRLQTFDAAMNKGKVTAERGAAYGHPKDDFDRAARIKAVVAECKDPLARHALEMIATKMARLIHTPDHTDSWVDIAGYARTGIMATDP